MRQSTNSCNDAGTTIVSLRTMFEVQLEQSVTAQKPVLRGNARVATRTNSIEFAPANHLAMHNSSARDAESFAFGRYLRKRASLSAWLTSRGVIKGTYHSREVLTSFAWYIMVAMYAYSKTNNSNSFWGDKDWTWRRRRKFSWSRTTFLFLLVGHTGGRRSIPLFSFY